MKKKGYSCFEVRERGLVNPIKHIARWSRNLKHAYQRIHYGYCERDVWSIDWWFLNVVPNMLEDLKDSTHGYPSTPDDFSQVFADSDTTEITNEGMRKWKEILSEMVFLFREANEDTCSKKNPYQEEYSKTSKEFKERYGVFGEGLKTDVERAEEKKKGYRRMYMLLDVPEYKEISDMYFAEERKINVYRCKCKDKGMALFITWFWNLWD